MARFEVGDKVLVDGLGEADIVGWSLLPKGVYYAIKAGDSIGVRPATDLKPAPNPRLEAARAVVEADRELALAMGRMRALDTSMIGADIRGLSYDLVREHDQV